MYQSARAPSRVNAPTPPNETVRALAPLSTVPPKSVLNVAAKEFQPQSARSRADKLKAEYLLSRPKSEVNIELYNIIPAEICKGLSSVAALFGKQMGDLRLVRAPTNYRGFMHGRYQALNAINIAIPCSLQLPGILRQQQFVEMSFIEFKNEITSIEQSYIRHERMTRLHLLENEAGICYDTLLRHPSPDLVYLEMPYTTVSPKEARYENMKILYTPQCGQLVSPDPTEQ